RRNERGSESTDFPRIETSSSCFVAYRIARWRKPRARQAPISWAFLVLPVGLNLRSPPYQGGCSNERVDGPAWRAGSPSIFATSASVKYDKCLPDRGRPVGLQGHVFKAVHLWRSPYRRRCHLIRWRIALTCTGVHAPPRAVAIPRAASARAMPRSDLTPLA